MSTDLKWTRHRAIGDMSEYRANGGEWKYTVDQPRKGQWVLRGWGPGDKFLYRDCFSTMAQAKREADRHNDDFQRGAR